MLDSLRRSANSWVVKILFLLLILSFGVWGVGDVVQSGISRSPAIQVGDVSYGADAVRARFDREVQRLKGLFGDQMTTELARQMGMVESTIKSMASEASLDMAARDLEVTVSTAGLQAAIVEEPAFQVNGAFDKQRYKDILAANALSEAAYVADLQRTLVRSRLVGSVAGNGSAPEPLADALFAYRQEGRVGESLTIAADRLTLEAAPSEDDLRKVYDQAVADFTTPELRALSVVLLTPKDVEGQAAVDDQAIKDYYDANHDQYATPEARTVSQVLTDSEDTARKVAELAASGLALADAATQAGAGAPIALGAVPRDGLPPEQAQAVFALEVGKTSQPLQSPFGWHVFTVEGMTPAAQKPLDAVREDIRTHLVQEQAVEGLYKASAAMDDALGGGAALEEVAKGQGLSVMTIAAVDAQGLGPDGKPVGQITDPKVAQAVFAEAFRLDQGAVSRVEEAGDGYFIVRLDNITPPTPKPLDSVKDAVRARWEAKARQDRAEALGRDLLAKLEAGESMATLATADGTVVHARHGAVTRDGAPVPGASAEGDKPLAPRLAAALFALAAPGKASTQATADGAVVLRLDAIRPADPTAAAKQKDALREELRQTMGADLAEATTKAFGDRFGVKIDRSVIDRAF